MTSPDYFHLTLLKEVFTITFCVCYAVANLTGLIPAICIPFVFGTLIQAFVLVYVQQSSLPELESPGLSKEYVIAVFRPGCQGPY